MVRIALVIAVFLSACGVSREKNRSEPNETAGVQPKSADQVAQSSTVASDEFANIGPEFYIVTGPSIRISQQEAENMKGKTCLENEIGHSRIATGFMFLICSPEFQAGDGSLNRTQLRSKKTPFWAPLMSVHNVYDKMGFYMTRDARHEAYELAMIGSYKNDTTTTVSYSTTHNEPYLKTFCSRWINPAELPKAYFLLCTSSDSTERSIFLDASKNFGDIHAEIDAQKGKKVYAERHGKKVEIPLVDIN